MKTPTLLAVLATAVTALAADPIDIDLFGGNPPGAPAHAEPDVMVEKPGDPIKRITHVQKPGIRVFLPPADKATGAAVVICPGGAYRILAIDHEGWQIAQWLNSFGVAGIVCKYRVSDKVGAAYQHPVPLLDAREAIREVRRHAAEWGVNPQRVGVMGFSAGGHLASTVDTLFDEQLPGEDAAEFAKMTHKPDFGILVYPVITMTQSFGHRGSADILLGKDAGDELRQKMSTETRVTAKTPPTILISTQDDTAVPPQNAMAFYDAMTKHKVPGELHVWESGGHGYGMLPGRGPVVDEWPKVVQRWLGSRGLLKK